MSLSDSAAHGPWVPVSSVQRRFNKVKEDRDGEVQCRTATSGLGTCIDESRNVDHCLAGSECELKCMNIVQRHPAGVRPRAITPIRSDSASEGEYSSIAAE